MIRHIIRCMVHNVPKQYIYNYYSMENSTFNWYTNKKSKSRDRDCFLFGSDGMYLLV